MKSVLISLKPKWVAKILEGKKTIEVRKTKPKIETPFKCYIYQTSGEKINGGWDCAIITKNDKIYYGGQQVVGEFICDGIKKFNIEELNRHNTLNYFLEKSQLSYLSLLNYVKTQETIFYAWDITNLKIYDKPKKLSEFRICVEKPLHENCRDCSFNSNNDCIGCGKYKIITRPPRSWYYVEEL